MRNVVPAFCFLMFVIIVSGALSADDAQYDLSLEKITDSIYFVTDKLGLGNSVFFTGDDGVLLIDSKNSILADNLLASVAESTDRPLRILINTHWHFDHVTGNKKIHLSGAALIAHENVRQRMSTEQHNDFFGKTYPPAHPAALARIVFDRSMTLYFNDDEVSLFHPGPAHTDGDAVVFFKNANVVHMGDLYFAGMYPFIDYSSGGSAKSMVAAIRRVLPMIDEATTVIPGHGPVANKAELELFVTMLEKTTASVEQLIEAGKPLEEIITAAPTKEYDENWGKGFLNPTRFTELLYRSLVQE